GQYEFELAGDPIASDFQGLVVGPKEPCRVRYRKRAQPSVTMSMAPALGKAAEEASMVDAAIAAGCPAHVHQNGSANGHAHKAPAAAKKLRVVLDRDLCQGHAVCVGEAP